jgi:PAS domain S-box-containing protein
VAAGEPALCAILGYSHEALLEKRFQDLTHPDDLDADLELVRRVLDGRIPSYQMEKRYLHADGSVVWAQLSVSLVRDEEGRPLHFVSQVTDISDRKHLEAELRRLATHDDLTGLHNRRAFEREIERQLRRVKRYGEQCAVLIADLDDFKSVNDTLGHHAGDELLRHVAGLLTRRLRESDVRRAPGRRRVRGCCWRPPTSRRPRRSPVRSRPSSPATPAHRRNRDRGRRPRDVRRQAARATP